MPADYTMFITDAQRASAQTGIPASITLGQIILESSGQYQNGLSGLAANYKNLFGVKGTGTAGSVKLPTTEVINGKYTTVNADFRAYNSYFDSILDHNKLLTNERYTSKTAGAKNVAEYAQGIAAAGYATDPSYADKLVSIINKYNLTQYDGKTSNTPSMGDFKQIEYNASDNSTTGKTSVDTAANSLNVAENFFFYTVRTIAVLGLVIIALVFFLKAFPAVEDGAKAVSNVVPAMRIAKAAKSASNVKKVATTAKQVKGAVS